VLINNRVLIKSGGNLVDHSVALSNIQSDTVALSLTAGTDFVYLGSDLPFNHRYLWLSAFNTTPAVCSVDLWSGSSWIPAIDVIDVGSVAGVPLARSGVLGWSPDPDQSSWTWDDTNDMQGSGLETLKIQGLYWARLSWSANITGTLKYVGHKFSDDAELEAEYPEFSRTALKTAFKSGLTNWDEQSLVAAEYIIRDLKTMNVIRQPDQILDWRLFSKPSVHKTAEIIFRAFGDDYKDNMIDSMRAYKSALDMKYYNVDKSRDATLQEPEKNDTTLWMSR
jgi:hypothetical protein